MTDREKDADTIARMIDEAIALVTPKHVGDLRLAQQVCDVVDDQPDGNPITWLSAWLDRVLR